MTEDIQLEEAGEEMRERPRRKKKKPVFTIIVVILAILVVGLYIWRVVANRNAFHAVFLRTGDLYFGKLVRFPKYGLKNIYFIQATGDETSPLSLQRFTNVFWAPEDKITINKDDVVWTAKIESESELATLLRTNPSLLPPQEQLPPQEGLPGEVPAQ